ncbi:uncharacterized protein LOC125289715 [Alosa alosa]|uniref:uncharacterized protein LOC125289715 n=1 Tax=Alosa alosa TaxID=278164 RepID=UPI002015230E|nr:uncharacterized protein LOC125289715 [Alosa alosa]
MNTLKKNLSNNETVIHIDYSENYSCKYSREVKDTHYSGGHQQISMHTGVRYLSRGRVECFCTISSCLRHDATATWAHLEPILKKMRRECPEVTVVHFLSDGPTSQYRNKTNFYLASTIPFMMGFQHVTWNFSEASHGKGAPDGVGGALKNLADRIVAYGTNIPDVDTLHQQLDAQSSVHILKITEDDINRSSELVPPTLKALPGTMKIHQLMSSSPGEVKTRELSCFCDGACECYGLREFSFRGKENVPEKKVVGDTIEVAQNEISEDTIEVGTWVLVQYDGDLFPGTVTQISNGQYEVDTMTAIGENKFYIPTVKFPGDKVWYFQDDIKAIIPKPLPITSSARHFCVLPEIWNKHSKKSPSKI